MTLNLVNQKNSDISYKVTVFPDSQKSIEILDDVRHYAVVDIFSRLNSFSDLELIICATKALRRLNIEYIKLYVPYFLGARSDRRFTENGIHYLKDVICPIINSLKFNVVAVVDPHSDVLEACLDNYYKISNFELVESALLDIKKEVTLVAPDAGAYKKIFDVAKEFDIKNIITASKVRDIATGKILRTEVALHEEDFYRSFVIVDDICDGGRTFIELAKVIRSEAMRYIPYEPEIYLVVTHGIFSAGFIELKKYFKKIYCTNSIQDLEPKDFIKQINIF